MATEESKQEIIAYLNEAEPTKEAGMQLWAKYGKNKAFDKVFFRPGDRYLSKLKYELSKLAGISHAEFNSGDLSGEKKLEIKPIVWPAIIHRIKDEIEKLVPQIADWHKQLVELGDANDDTTKAKAMELGELIDEANERYQLLYDAKEEYFLKDVHPNEADLYPSAPDETDPFGLKKLTGAQLVTQKGNLESSLSKDRNQLLYQSKKKEAEENPMPQGDERTKVEARIANKIARLEAIIALLNAGQS